MATSKHRSSVLIFLFSPPVDNHSHQVLLSTSSEDGHAPNGNLIPISNSFYENDGTAAAAAWRTLQEATGLGTQHIDLWRIGPGISVQNKTPTEGEEINKDKDDSHQTIWPFAFRLKKCFKSDGNVVESLEVDSKPPYQNGKWYSIGKSPYDELFNKCTTMAKAAFKQLWVDPDSVLHEKLEHVGSPSVVGAKPKATAAVGSLIALVEHDQMTRVLQSSDDVVDWWRDFRLRAFHLAFNAKPSMAAAISSAVVIALKQAQSSMTTENSNVLSGVQKSLQQALKRRQDVSTRVSTHFSSLIQDKFLSAPSGNAKKSINILTLSVSSTAKLAIIHALDADQSLYIELRIIESRPKCEGLSLAQGLTDEAQRRQDTADAGPPFHDRLRIVIASDASVGILSRNVDMVILGSDRISEAGDVSNKNGSLATVLTSKEITDGRVKVVCVSETEKIAPPGAMDEHADEERDVGELLNAWKFKCSSMWDVMVSVRNVYFEWVPAKYIDYYVCEDGILSTDGIGEKSKQVADLIKEIFSDL